jgi:hypothetical protein
MGRKQDMESDPSVHLRMMQESNSTDFMGEDDVQARFLVGSVVV